MIDLRQERRERGDADETRHPQADEYSRILGDEWEAMGDGTYRFVGKQTGAPQLRWADRPLAASNGTPEDPDRDPEQDALVEEQKRRPR